MVADVSPNTVQISKVDKDELEPDAMKTMA